MYKFNLIIYSILILLLFSGRSFPNFNTDTTDNPVGKRVALKVGFPKYYRGEQEKGPRDKMSILRVVTENIDNLRKSYNQRINKYPDLKGVITLKIKISKSGKCRCKILSSNTGDYYFDTQIREKVSNWVFEPCNDDCKTTVIGYSFNFSESVLLIKE